MKKFKCYCGQLLRKRTYSDIKYDCMRNGCPTVLYFIIESKIEAINLAIDKNKYISKVYCTKKWYSNNTHIHEYVVRVVDKIDMKEFSKFVENLTLLG